MRAEQNPNHEMDAWQPRLLAAADASVALDQRRGLPDRHAAVRDHRHHAQPRLADRVEAERRRTHRAASGRAARAGESREGRGQAPAAAAVAKLHRRKARCAGRASADAEWSQEIYVSLPRPGGDAWLSIDLDTGEARYEITDRGWIAWLNDLHKGRHTGLAWSLFIDVFSVACVVFCITGLVLLQLLAGQRPSTWPLVGLGLVIPLLLAIFFIH